MADSYITGGGTPFPAEDMVSLQRQNGHMKIEDWCLLYNKCYGAELVVHDASSASYDILFLLKDGRYMEIRSVMSLYPTCVTEAEKLIGGVCNTYRHWYYRTTGEFIKSSPRGGLREVFRREWS